MSNSKDFKVKNGIQPTVYNEGVGTVVSAVEGYSIGSAVYDSKSFSVNAQDTNANGFTFNATGTKLYVVGRTNNSIFQYSLSTAYDISTASYDSVSFSVATQETNPIEAVFKSDGTKLYVVGWGGDAVFQYGLTTAYDISTASYDSVSFSFASQDSVAGSIYFKPDGTKFYILGAANDTVFQYSMTTAWDLSTASYDSVSFSFSSQETNPYGLLFNSDGTKMFVTGNTGDATFQYSLTTAWDLSTASYDSVSLDHTTVMTDPFGTRFNSDGSKFYVIASNDTIYQYSTTLNTNTLDLSTGAVFEITPTSDIQIGLSNPAASGTVSAATLLLDGAGTTGYDLGNASYTNKSYTITEESQPYAMFFKSDGTKMYAVGIVNDAVYQYSLSTAWDVSTASYDSVSFSVSSQSSDPQGGLVFSPDGTKMYVGSQTGSDTIYQYTLSTAWDLSTASYASKSFTVATQVPSMNCFRLNSDGTKMFALNGGDDTIYQYTLSTAYDISTASYASLTYTITEDTIPKAFDFNNDGTQLIVVGATNDDVFQYTLGTAYTINTASYDNVSLDGSTQFGNPHDVLYSGDGKNLYVLDLNTDTVYQYSTATPATITYDSTLEFAGGTAPTSQAIGETDVITISTRDGGTTYQAVQAIDGAK
jgi:DNA-binding beta-propeller fold protein YncE